MATILGSLEHKEWWELMHVDGQGRTRPMDPKRNLTNYLRMYFAGVDDDLARLSITCKETDGVGGKVLNPVFVSRLQVGYALARLEAMNALGVVALRLHLGGGQGWRQIAKTTGCAMSDVQAEYDVALQWLVDHIYEWTEAGQELARQADARRAKEHQQRMGRTG